MHQKNHRKNFSMVKIIKEKIEIEEALKKKLEFVCSFCNTKCKIQKDSIKTIEKNKSILCRIL